MQNVRQVRLSNGKARGAALLETIVLTIMLVPLLFGTAMIGKLIDIRQTAVLASRHAVWESTVHGAGAAPDDVHHRFFGRDVGGDGARPGTVSAFHEGVTGGQVTRRVEDAVHAAADVLGGRSGGEWDVTVDGLVRGGVTVPIGPSGWLPRGAMLAESSVIMTDGWSAGDDDEFRMRTKSFVPAGALERVGDVLSGVAIVPMLGELEGLEGALGKVDVETLPFTERHTLQPYAEGAR